MIRAGDLSERAARLRSTLPAKKAATAPPREEGTVLLELEREGGILRVAWNTYEGRPFLQVRLWTRDDQGGLWPTQRGVTVRVRELADFAEAVSSALELAEQHARFDAERRAV